MHHLVNWLRNHYQDQTEFVVVVLGVLVAAAIMIAVALMFLV